MGGRWPKMPRRAATPGKWSPLAMQYQLLMCDWESAHQDHSPLICWGLCSSVDMLGSTIPMQSIVLLVSTTLRWSAQYIILMRWSALHSHSLRHWYAQHHSSFICPSVPFSPCGALLDSTLLRWSAQYYARPLLCSSVPLSVDQGHHWGVQRRTHLPEDFSHITAVETWWRGQFIWSCFRGIYGVTRRSYVKTYAVNVNTSRAPEEGAHSPSCPNGLIIIIVIIIIRIYIYYIYIRRDVSYIFVWVNLEERGSTYLINIVPSHRAVNKSSGINSHTQ
jgi:hypothetical protein